jgi:hypothetical protein
VGTTKAPQTEAKAEDVLAAGFDLLTDSTPAGEIVLTTEGMQALTGLATLLGPRGVCATLRRLHVAGCKEADPADLEIVLLAIIDYLQEDRDDEALELN